MLSKKVGDRKLHRIWYNFLYYANTKPRRVVYGQIYVVRKLRKWEGPMIHTEFKVSFLKTSEYKMRV